MASRHKRRASLLRAVLHDAIPAGGCREKQLTFAEIVAAGLFDVHVLAGLKRENRRRRVPVIGRGDDYGVDCLVVQQAAHVGDGSRGVNAGLLGGVGKPLRVRVADIIGVVEESATPAAAADQRHDDLVIRAAARAAPAKPSARLPAPACFKNARRELLAMNPPPDQSVSVPLRIGSA